MTEEKNYNLFQLLELNKSNMMSEKPIVHKENKEHKRSKSNGVFSLFDSNATDTSVIEEKEDELKNVENLDHFETERIHFYDLVQATKQNILQYSEEKDVKLKERYCWAINENLKLITQLKDLSILKFKDVKGKHGFWKRVGDIDKIIEKRKEEIKEMKIELELLNEKINKCLGK